MWRWAAIVAGVVLAAGPAAAQALPELLFQAEAQTLTGTCTGQPVRLEGNHDTVTLSGACGSLLLKGVGNTVRLGVVPGASIHVEGSGNRVAYAVTGAPPDIVMLGPDNEVASGIAPVVQLPPSLVQPARPAAAPVPPPSAALPASAPPASPPLASPPIQAQASPGPLNLQGDDQQHLADCTGRDVTVTGERSAYVLRGGCKSLTLRGNLLTVQAELAPGARVTVSGRGSIVSWAMRAKGKPPAVVAKGEGSRIQRVTVIGGEAVR